MNRSAATTFESAFNTAAAGVVSLREVVSHRGYLVRFAQRRLHDPALAEDVVHDVFEAVISGNATFAGRASLRSWLTAILKNKIVDLVRSRVLTDSFEDIEGEDEGSSGYEIECPQPRPDQLAEQRQFLAATLSRIDALPASLRDVMRLRVIHERPTDEVCATLHITEDNLFVRLHRARRQLLC